VTTSRASGEDGAGRDVAALLARAGRAAVVPWTADLRVAAERASLVPCVLGREAIVHVRDLHRSRGPLVAIATGCAAHIRISFELALVHVEGEPSPRFVCASRLSPTAIADAQRPPSPR